MSQPVCVIAVILGIMAQVGCERATQPAAGAAASRLDAAATSAAADRATCRATREEHERVSAAATNTCTADSECACYSEPWAEGAGTVADSATVAKLGAIRARYVAAGCPQTMINYRKAPPRCVPTCVAGRCTSGR